MRVLVACEYSGRVRDAFAKLGHDAWSCDILDSESPGNHIKDDVLNHLDKNWDLIVAHPPCTYLSNSGVMWLHKQEGRWEKMKAAAGFFKRFLEVDCPRVAIENPIMHKYGKELIGENQSQVIQPYMFGHKEQKATCLWLKGLKPLVETDNVKQEMMKLSNKERQRLHYLPPSKDRAKLRSMTFQGIADAMASQWGKE